MPKDLLLEIGIEEAPAGFMPGLLSQLGEVLSARLSAARLGYAAVKTLGTPRRLVVWIQELEERQADVQAEARGPKRQAAYDEAGEPTKALLGFMRAQQVESAQLEIRELSGTEYVFAVKPVTGQPAAEILPELLTAAILGMTFPKSMRWAYSTLRFVRPIRWLLALYGDELLPFKIGTVESALATCGHRFLSSGALPVSSIPQYFTTLREHYVIVDPQERLELIRDGVREAAASAGGESRYDEALLLEVAYLVEYPTAFVGHFSASYLEVPVEVLTTTMIHNQKYFPVFDDQEQLMNCFIGVRNGTGQALPTVAAGNERVLKARLEDALFFWNEDRKKSMDTWEAQLSSIMFHEKMGTMRDKSERLERLAVHIGAELKLSTPLQLKRAARLSKADLLSSMVYEFPELQGIMGAYYARLAGENEEVAAAVREHYLPRFAADRLPESDTGFVLSLAEKLDNITGFFMIGQKPSGSQDPYALRRQTLGIIHMILARGLAVDLKALIGFAYANYSTVREPASLVQVLADLKEFVAQRMRGVLLEQGYTHDVVEAVLASGVRDVLNCARRVKSVSAAKQEPYFEDFMTVYNRANNLSKNWSSEEVRPEYLADASETALWQLLQETRPVVEAALAAHDYDAVLRRIAGLRPAVDAFFAAVMIMAEEAEVKANRLGLLKMIAAPANNIAGFSHLVP
jgi:glycyl-tRNA synthetase beta chain